MITAQQIAAGLRAFAAALETQAGTAGNAYVDPNALAQQQFAAQQAVAQQQQPPSSAPQNLTGQQLVDLIQPHIGNDAIKAALGEVMRANGVANLPDALPHQYGLLYGAFQQVLSRFGIGAPQVQQQVQQQPTTSII